ncbi:ATP-binding cassette domain-containing protein [Streptomyces sp. IBSNAI002]|uniref:ATP-binding cassette domain-containing protein n=1 Tax=Streptomyces sp. IBSNAI002 TaxID=3457500 RepID=UPI003FD5A87C
MAGEDGIGPGIGTGSTDGIEVRGLSKRFGATQALDGMSFAVRPGRVTGFVGPNGAGKSTTMRVVLGLDAPDAGRALVGGRPYRSLAEPLRELGSLLDAGALQPSRTARDHLLWLARTQGLPATRVDRVLGDVGLADAARRRAGGFSLGMRQRLGIAAALLGDPPALMLDEPFNGLDPEGIRWIRTLLTTLAAEGRAVLVSSHLMSELEGVADHLVVVGRGRVVADTGVRELLAGVAAGRVTLRTAALPAAAHALKQSGAVAEAAGPDTLTVTGMAAEAIVARLTETGVPFAELAAHRVTLEEAYLELTRDSVQYRSADASTAAAEGAGR